MSKWTPVQRAVANEFARHDFYFFCRWMFQQRVGAKWLRGQHHKDICDALMRVFEGEILRLVINIAPRYSKSELLVMFICWTLGKCPWSEYLYISYSAELAEDQTRKAREVIEHPAYREIFPHVQIKPDHNAGNDWATTSGGVVYGTGSGGTIVGKGGGKERPGFGGFIGIDDPHKPDEVRSDTVRGGVITNFVESIWTRQNSNHTPIIVIMQRLDEADLSGWLLGPDPLEEGLTLRKPGGNGEAWWHLRIPTIRSDGTALWPEKHTIETLRMMQTAAPFMFSGQYDQSPSQAEGNVFKPHMLQIVDAIPAGTRFVRGWDMAATVPEPGKDPDWTVGFLLGLCEDGRFIIADLVRFKGSPDEVEAAMVNTKNSDGANVTIKLPQDPGQAGKSQVAYLTRKLAGAPVKAEPVSGDKITRAEPFAAQVNIGNVMMLRASWNKEITDEFRTFPNGRHDDIVDAGSDAFNTHTGGNFGILDYFKRMGDANRKQSEAEAAADSVGAGAGQALINAMRKQRT